jgi:hypothetical protein
MAEWERWCDGGREQSAGERMMPGDPFQDWCAITSIRKDRSHGGTEETEDAGPGAEFLHSLRDNLQRDSSAATRAFSALISEVRESSTVATLFPDTVAPSGMATAPLIVTPALLTCTTSR